MSELSEEERERVKRTLQEVREALLDADQHIASARAHLARLKQLLGTGTIPSTGVKP